MARPRLSVAGVYQLAARVYGGNDLSELVLMLGADVNSGINMALRFNTQGRQKQTILDAVHGVVAQAKKGLDATEKSAQTQNQGNGEKEKFGILASSTSTRHCIAPCLPAPAQVLYSLTISAFSFRPDLQGLPAARDPTNAPIRHLLDRSAFLPNVA